MVETLVSPIGPLKDPNPHQILQHRVLNTTPGLLGHLFPSPDRIPPELVISQALRQGVVMPLVDVKLRPIRTSLTKLHPLCDLKERVSDQPRRSGTLSDLLIGGIPHIPPSNGVGRVVAKVEPLAGPPLVSPSEVECPVFKIGRVTVHQIPQGSSVGFSTGRREHRRRSSVCEKMKSGLMGIPTSKSDSSYPFSAQPIRR